MRETVKFSISDQEYGALARLAEQELRPIPMQAQHLVIEALRRERLLPEKQCNLSRLEREAAVDATI